MSPSGYSGTPLARKLGVNAGCRLYPVHAPENYLDLLAPLPEDMQVVEKPGRDVDVFHLFTTHLPELQTCLEAYVNAMRPDATIWVSWPKKASCVPSEVTEDVVRDAALPLGLVDVKVCAIDETWSGLKLVLRLEYR